MYVTISEFDRQGCIYGCIESIYIIIAYAVLHIIRERKYLIIKDLSELSRAIIYKIKFL